MFDAMNNLFDLAMRPLIDWPPEASCALWSVVIGLVLLAFFKYVSMQERIERVKDKMTACVLGVWLYRDQPGMIARCQAAAVGHGMHYLGLSTLPLLVMALPMIVVLAQMNAYLAHRPIETGECVLVKVTVPPGVEAGDVKLTPPMGTGVAARHVDPNGREAVWKVVCSMGRGGPLTFDVGGESVTKALVMGDDVTRIEPARTTGGFWHRLFYPSEPPLPEGGAIESIEINYPARDLKLLVWPCHWLWSSFAVMLVAVLIFRKPMGVAI